MNVKEFFHRAGINLRHLGKLMSCKNVFKKALKIFFKEKGTSQNLFDNRDGFQSNER